LWAPAAGAGTALTASKAAASIIGRRIAEMNIVNAPIGLHLPGLNRVVVVDRIATENFSQRRERRLNEPGLIDRPRFQTRRLTVPPPGDREARQRLCQHRLLQLGLLPDRAANGGDEH